MNNKCEKKNHESMIRDFGIPRFSRFHYSFIIFIFIAGGVLEITSRQDAYLFRYTSRYRIGPRRKL